MKTIGYTEILKRLLAAEIPIANDCKADVSKLVSRSGVKNPLASKLPVYKDYRTDF